MNTPAPPTAPNEDTLRQRVRTTLEADYFDGRSTRPRRVAVWVQAGRLHVAGEGVARNLPLSEVHWPERTRNGARIAHLEGGGSLQSADAETWDRWVQAAGIQEALVVTAQQSWRGVLVAATLLVLVAVAGYRWGLPWGARAVLTLVPPTADEKIGDVALESMASNWLEPTELPAARQARLRAELARAVTAAYPPTERPAYTLHFHKSKIGPNAFALPGGHVVLTDELVRLLDDDEAAIIGVLAHELGHVRHRHGMRMLIQSTLLAAAASVAFGDFSSVIAGAPALLGHMAYSRAFEREADDESIAVLRAAGLPPEAMVKLFERLPFAEADGSLPPPCPAAGQAPDAVPAASDAASGASRRKTRRCLPADPQARAAQAAERELDTGIGIAFSSHPANAERIQRFREAAQPRR